MMSDSDFLISVPEVEVAYVHILQKLRIVWVSDEM
jgi:hypothetical protein